MSGSRRVVIGLVALLVVWGAAAAPAWSKSAITGARVGQYENATRFVLILTEA